MAVKSAGDRGHRYRKCGGHVSVTTPSLSSWPVLLYYLSISFSFRLFLQSESRTMDENEAQITIESQTMADLDNRDPKEIHEEGARVEFEDVIAEHDGLHSLNCMWKVSYHTFTQTKLWIYRFFTLILGFPLSLLWGLLFACLSFLHIWIVVPCLRTLQFNFYCLLRPLLQLIRVCLLPLFKVTGKLLSKVKFLIRKEA